MSDINPDPGLVQVALEVIEEMTGPIARGGNLEVVIAAARAYLRLRAQQIGVK